MFETINPDIKGSEIFNIQTCGNAQSLFSKQCNTDHSIAGSSLFKSRGQHTPVLEMVTVSGSSFDQRICHTVKHFSTSFLFLTIVFNADSAIPNLAASVTHASLLASTCATMSIFSWIENAFLFLGSLTVMKNRLHPEIKIRLVLV